MEEGVKNKKTRWWIIIIVALVFMVVFVAIFLIFRKRSGALNLVMAPVSSEVMIDGKNYTGKTSISLEVGMHELLVEKFGFEPHTEEVQIKESEETTIYVALEPIITITQSWYDEHTDDAKIRTLVNEKNAEIELAEAAHNYPGIAKLPYDGGSFRLSYSRCVPVEVYEEDCVLISAGNKMASAAAMKYFKNNIDSDIGKYYFVYSKSGNPFADGANMDKVPVPTEEIDGYGVAIFEVGGQVYRALFLKIYDEYVLSGLPAPVLNYNSFVGVPVEVIDKINEMEVK